MKVHITINDLTFDEARNILGQINNKSVQVFDASGTFTKPAEPVVVGGAVIAGGLQPLPAASSIPPHQAGNNSAAAPVNTGGGEVDAEGMPWDERIHSSSLKKTARGVWVRRKNVAEAQYIEIVNELRSRGNGGNAAAHQPGGIVQPVAGYTPPAPGAHVAPAYTPPPLGAPQSHNPMAPNYVPAPQHSAPAYTPPAPVAPVQPAYVPPAPAAPAGQPTIVELFGKIQTMFANGTADAAYMNSLTGRLSQQFQVQVGSVNDIANRPDMIAYAFQLLAQDGK